MYARYAIASFKMREWHHRQREEFEKKKSTRCIALHFSLHLSSRLAGNELKARLKAIEHDVDFSIGRRFETRNARCGIHDCTFSHAFRAISLRAFSFKGTVVGERLVSHVGCGRTRKLRTIERFAHLK